MKGLKRCPLQTRVCDGDECEWWVRDQDLTNEGCCAVKMIAKMTRILAREKK